MQPRKTNGSLSMVRYGPGIWHTIHSLAITSNTETAQIQFCQLLKTIITSLPCSICKGHANQYYADNDPMDWVWRESADERDEDLVKRGRSCDNIGLVKKQYTPVKRQYAPVKRQYAPVKRQYAMFNYTVKFHNMVNVRNGKDEMPFDIAFDLYASRFKEGDEYIITLDYPYNTPSNKINRRRSPRRRTVTKQEIQNNNIRAYSLPRHTGRY